MSATQPIKNKNDLTRFRNYYKEEELKPRNYALIVMGLNSALRIGDILSLRWEDVRRESAYRRHIWIREQKTRKDNMFPVNPMMVEALEFYRHYLTGYSSEKYIFESQKDRENPISRSQAFRIIKKAADQCGLREHISCHSLRKTFGYYAWKQGTPPALLMSIYNHSSYEITKRYLCIDQQEKDKVYMEIQL